MLNSRLAKQKDLAGKKAISLREQIADKEQKIKAKTAAYLNNAMEMIDKLAIDGGGGDDTMTPNAEQYF